MTIGKLEENFVFGGSFGNKKVTDLYDSLTIASPDSSNIIKVTGALKYATWTEFNTNTADTEQEGHYLPIQIKAPDAESGKDKKVTVTGSKEKELNFGATDGSIELAMFVDKLVNKGNGRFTVACDGVTYTVDCTGLILLPNAAENTEVKADTTTGNVTATIKGEGDTAVSKAELPKDLNETINNPEDKMEVVVEKNDNANTVADQIKGDDSASTIIKDAIKGAEQIITVKITKNGEEQYTDSNALAGQEITITFPSVQPGTYHVLSVNSKGTVTSFGYKTVSGTAADIVIKTGHLTDFVLVKEDDNSAELRAAVNSAAVTQEPKANRIEGEDKDSGDANKYAITALTAANGRVSIAVDNAIVTEASAGKTVTLTTTPNNGYKLQSIKVTTGAGDTEEVVLSSTTSPCTFTMPSKEVKITATFVAVPASGAKCVYQQDTDYFAPDQSKPNQVVFKKSLYGGKLVLTGLEKSSKYVIQFAKKGNYNGANSSIVIFETGDSTTASIDVLYNPAGYTVGLLKYPSGGITTSQELLPVPDLFSNTGVNVETVMGIK